MNFTFWKIPDRKLLKALTLSAIILATALTPFAFAILQPRYAILGAQMAATPFIATGFAFNLPNVAMSLSTLAGVYSIYVYSAMALLTLAALVLTGNSVKFWGRAPTKLGTGYFFKMLSKKTSQQSIAGRTSTPSSMAALRSSRTTLPQQVNLLEKVRNLAESLVIITARCRNGYEKIRNMIASSKLKGFYVSMRSMTASIPGSTILSGYGLMLVAILGMLLMLPLALVNAMPVTGPIADASAVSTGQLVVVPVPEFSGIAIVAFSALAAALYLLRRRRP